MATTYVDVDGKFLKDLTPFPMEDSASQSWNFYYYYYLQVPDAASEHLSTTQQPPENQRLSTEGRCSPPPSPAPPWPSLHPGPCGSPTSSWGASPPKLGFKLWGQPFCHLFPIAPAGFILGIVRGRCADRKSCVSSLFQSGTRRSSGAVLVVLYSAREPRVAASGGELCLGPSPPSRSPFQEEFRPNRGWSSCRPPGASPSRGARKTKSRSFTGGVASALKASPHLVFGPTGTHVSLAPSE